MVLVLVGFVVFVERGQRRIPIQHARRVVGRRVSQGGMSYFPLRVNTAGVIPPIFASSLLMFPLTIRQFSSSPAIQHFIDTYLNPGSMLYNALYVGLIIFFCYFYTAIMINPVRRRREHQALRAATSRASGPARRRPSTSTAS